MKLSNIEVEFSRRDDVVLMTVRLQDGASKVIMIVPALQAAQMGLKLLELAHQCNEITTDEAVKKWTGPDGKEDKDQ